MVVDNGLVMFLWIGLAASSDWVHNVLGVASVTQVDIDKVKYSQLLGRCSVFVDSLHFFVTCVYCNSLSSSSVDI